MLEKVNWGIWRNLKLEIVSTDAWYDTIWKNRRKIKETLAFSKWQAVELFSELECMCVCVCVREIWEHLRGEGKVKVKRRKKQRQLPSEPLLSPGVRVEPGKEKEGIRQGSIGDKQLV